jgi:hypothetical protein
VGAFWPKPPEAPEVPEAPDGPELGALLLLLGALLLLLGALLLFGSLLGLLILGAANAAPTKPTSIKAMAVLMVAFVNLIGLRTEISS